MTFSADGKYLVSCGYRGPVQIWRVKDGEQMATINAKHLLCLAVSRDGKWIAAGTWEGVIVWNAETYERVFTHDSMNIGAVDFSPSDSSRLVVASLEQSTATVWDLRAHKQVQTLDHSSKVRAAKFSSQGDRIATATEDCVRVYDSNDGRILIEIPVIVTPWFNTGLLWFNNHFFVVSTGKIMEFDASTGSVVSEWPVPDSNKTSCIALLQNSECIVYSSKRTVTFWATSTHTPLGLIQHSEPIHSIALSPDDKSFAIGGQGVKTTIYTLSRITVSTVFPCITACQNNFLTPLVLSTPRFP